MKSVMATSLSSTLAMLSAAVLNAAFAQDKPRPQPAENALLLTAATVTWNACGAEDQGIPKGCEYALLHDDSRSGVSSVLVRVPASARFPRLWHSTAEHGVMIQGRFVGLDEAGKEFSVPAGAYWYIPAGAIHGGVRCSDEGPCLFFEAYESAFDLNVVK
jgi:quercetin dioxygenase-like cupin family protein